MQFIVEKHKLDVNKQKIHTILDERGEKRKIITETKEKNTNLLPQNGRHWIIERIIETSNNRDN